MFRFSLASLLLTVTFAGILVAVLVAPRSTVPRLFSCAEVNSLTLAEAANYFADMGEERATQELILIANRSPSHLIRAGLVCRILWRGSNEPIRPPLHCVYMNFEYEPSKLNAWPLYPLAVSGESFFALDMEYLGGGEMEQIDEYIKHCRKHGTFTKHLNRLPTRATTLVDAKNLIKSTRWVTEFNGRDDSSSIRCIQHQTKSLAGTSKNAR